jgi:hypothetical protein
MTVLRRSCAGLLLLGIAACGGHSSPPQTPPPAKEPIASRPPKVYIDSARLDQSKLPIKPDSSDMPAPGAPAPPDRPRVAPPEAAFRRGWMPLASTGLESMHFGERTPTPTGAGY